MNLWMPLLFALCLPFASFADQKSEKIKMEPTENKLPESVVAELEARMQNGVRCNVNAFTYKMGLVQGPKHVDVSRYSQMVLDFRALTATLNGTSFEFEDAVTSHFVDDQINMAPITPLLETKTNIKSAKTFGFQAGDLEHYFYWTDIFPNTVRVRFRSRDKSFNFSGPIAYIPANPQSERIYLSARRDLEPSSRMDQEFKIKNSKALYGIKMRGDDTTTLGAVDAMLGMFGLMPGPLLLKFTFGVGSWTRQDGACVFN